MLKKSEPRHELDVVLNPNCSEAVMKVPGMPLHDALTMLEGIGIHASEIGMDRFVIDYKPASDDFDTAFTLRDKNNLAIPYDPRDPKDARWETIDPIFKDIEELLEDDSIDDDEYYDISLSRDWLYERGYIKIAARGDDWVISARNPRGPRCRPTMLAIEKLFNQQWDMPEDIQERDYNPWKAKVTKLVPNCSEVVFKLPGLTKDEALAILKKHGIVEVEIPLKLLSGDENDDVTWNVIADRDNPLVPNLDAEYGLTHVTIEEWNGVQTILGGLNLELSALPTMKKIADAFPNGKWEEVTGGGMTDELAEWIANGMKYTKRQENIMKDEVFVPGKDTMLVREKIVDPAFQT